MLDFFFGRPRRLVDTWSRRNVRCTRIPPLRVSQLGVCFWGCIQHIPTRNHVWIKAATPTKNATDNEKPMLHTVTNVERILVHYIDEKHIFFSVFRYLIVLYAPFVPFSVRACRLCCKTVNVQFANTMSLFGYIHTNLLLIVSLYCYLMVLVAIVNR